jgi:hypothetical protein
VLKERLEMLGRDDLEQAWGRLGEAGRVTFVGSCDLPGVATFSSRFQFEFLPSGKEKTKIHLVLEIWGGLWVILSVPGDLERSVACLAADYGLNVLRGVPIKIEAGAVSRIVPCPPGISPYSLPAIADVRSRADRDPSIHVFPLHPPDTRVVVPHVLAPIGEMVEIVRREKDEVLEYVACRGAWEVFSIVPDDGIEFRELLDIVSPLFVQEALRQSLIKIDSSSCGCPPLSGDYSPCGREVVRRLGLVC